MEQQTPLERESKSAGVPIHNSLKNNPQAAWELEDALGQPLSPRAAQTAAVVMIHALAQTWGEHPPTRASTLAHWERVVASRGRLRFLPIIPPALRLMQALPQRTSEQIIQAMTGAAGQAGDAPAAGNVLQKLAPRRKHLSVYHTRPEAAALMAHLAIPGNLDWSDPETVTGYHMADYSCGTGELLAAAYRLVRELHRGAGGNPSLVHAAMLENAITAVDILPASVALAASDWSPTGR